MRYSLLLHDVREQFDLTVAQYLVADSIHQLSRKGVCTASDVQIANFIGFSRESVCRAKSELITKGLVEAVKGGYTTTDTWFEAVALCKNVTPLSKNVTEGEQKSHTIKIYKDTIPAHASREVVEVKEEDDSRPKRSKKTTPAMEEVFGIFTDNPARVQWKQREVERDSAQALYDNYGIDLLRKRYADVLKYRDHLNCPFVNSPSSMLEKMGRLEYFFKSVNG